MRHTPLSRSVTPLMLFASSCIGLAQVSTSTGNIQGTVSDPTGAAVAGASVTLANSALALTRQTVTQSDGTFVFTALQPTVGYQVTVEMKGFERQVLSDLTVRVTETTVANANLVIGSVSQQVVVEGNAEQVQTTNPTLGGVMTSQVIVDLPLPSRSVLDLFATDPGVGAEFTSPAGTILQGSQALYVAGNRATENNYLINGVDANNFEFHTLAPGIVPVPNPDAVQEFRTETSLYDATTGFAAGGNITLVTRAGTSHYHGEAYEFFRNTVLNANDFFLNAEGVARPVYQQNQFGGSFGGPIPKLRNTFFFVNYEGLRQKNGVAGSINAVQPVLPATRNAASLAAAFGLPVSAIDPVAVNILNAPGPYGGKLFPSGSGAPVGQLGIYGFSSPVTYDPNQVNARIDHDFGKNHLSASGFVSKGTFTNLGGANDGILGQAYNYPLVNDTMSIEDTQIIRPNLLNDFIYGFTYNQRDINSINPLTVQDIGMSRFNSAFTNGTPNIEFIDNESACCGASASVDQTQHNASFDARDTVSYIRGKHSLRFGFETRRQQFNYRAPYDRGTLVFGNFIADGLYGTPANSANDLAFRDFLIGAPFEIAISSGLTEFGYRAHDYIGFAQDDFRVTHRLTLNLGLRYDYLGNVTEVNNHLPNYDPSLLSQQTKEYGGPGLQAGVVLPGTPGVSDSTLTNPNNLNFAPRVGFAYDVLGNGKLAVRGGYGIYHQRIAGGGPLQTLGDPPYELGVDNLQFTSHDILSNPFPNLPLPTQFPAYPAWPTLTGYDSSGNPVFNNPEISVSTIDRNLHTPYAENWNFTIQDEFLPNWVVEVGYLGSRGVHLIATQATDNALLRNAQDPAAYGLTTNSSTNRDARVPVVGFGAYGIFEITGNGESYYDAGILSVSHRFAHGLFFKSAYTFSKAIDNYPASSGFDINGTANGNQFDENLNKGLANFDQTHRWVTTYAYDIPGFKTGRMRWVLGNWFISGITTFQSGFPGEIDQNIGNDSLSGTNGYGLVLPNCQLQTTGSVDSHLTNYLNAACVTTTPLLVGGQTFGPLSPYETQGNQTYTITPAPPGQSSTCAANGTCSGRLQGPSTRGAFRNPFQQRWDFTAGKRFPVRSLGEGANLEIRGEFFKLFNTPIFSGPDSTVGTSLFGYITSTIDNTGRQIQFAAKLNF